MPACELLIGTSSFCSEHHRCSHQGVCTMYKALHSTYPLAVAPVVSAVRKQKRVFRKKLRKGPLSPFEHGDDAVPNNALHLLSLLCDFI